MEQIFQDVSHCLPSSPCGYPADVEVATRISHAGSILTKAERRVAEVVLNQPQLVGFGTVADLADAAEAGAATVVRLATKLNYDGFTALQAAVQRDLAQQLRPAAVRIREAQGGTEVQNHLAREVENVQATLLAADSSVIAAAVAHLSDTSHPVLVLSGDASAGVSQQFASELLALRPQVEMLVGNEVAVTRRLALCRPGDCLIVVDLSRYDRWVVAATEHGRARGAWILALTDSVLSPLSRLADSSLVLTAGGVSPFDSHVGTLALMNVLVAGVAGSLRSLATERLDLAEAAWNQRTQLVER
jgi:DNA-binding MurR/RpiR family transcriptional regulator